MKTINALELSGFTLKSFERLLKKYDEVSIEFWNNPIGIICLSPEDNDLIIVDQITLPRLCRGSKINLKHRLTYHKGNVIEIISGQHDKKIVGYLVGV